MQHFLLINPNSSEATTGMMVAIASTAADKGLAVVGATARRSPAMIVSPTELEAAAAEVIEIGRDHAADCIGIIVSAYGDPGVHELRQQVAIPVIGICEASMLVAAESGRRFGIATVTPDLIPAIDAHARRLGLAAQYSGIRSSSDEPRQLAKDPLALRRTLALEVEKCFTQDNAEIVIIGGGPLGAAAEALKDQFDHPVLSPIPCAVSLLARQTVRSRRLQSAT